MSVSAGGGEWLWGGEREDEGVGREDEDEM